MEKKERDENKIEKTIITMRKREEKRSGDGRMN